ncbi:MAG: class I SAM-dependent methyltransferase [Chloroflexota bacterium]|nr:class I SAM-dependent methyltransferase [Chloroflexota bacterium]
MELNIDFVDLDWGDENVIPETIHPDTQFIFDKMSEIVMGMVDPKDGELILDIGCGRSVDALKLAESGAKAIGLDPSSKMMIGSREHIGDANVYLVRALGEVLPFKPQSLDKLFCKGALDHFADMEKTMTEMSQSLKPGGMAIIAIANYESLACRLGKWWFPIVKRLYRKDGHVHPWMPPDDHNYKFDCPILKATVKDRFDIVKLRGMSLLWTAPYWGKILSMMPKWMSNAVVKFLDWIACLIPSLSDVLIIKLTPKKG